MQVVCSNKPRPSVGTSNRRTATGAAAWGRDVHHLAESGKTLCGRDASDWLVMDIPVESAKADHNCCARCADKH